MLVSAGVALYLVHTIRRRAGGFESPIVAAEALHHSLGLTSHTGVILALALQSWTGIVYFDPFVSLLISAVILWQVKELLTRTAHDLLDGGLPTELQSKIVEVVQEHGGAVVDYHGLRTRSAGTQKQVTLHLVLCRAISFETSHQIVDHIEEELRSAIPRADVTTHADPCGCACPLEPECPWARLLRRGG